MSFVLPVLYHWSPEQHRKSITRRGLRPTCPTNTVVGPPMKGTVSVRPIDHEASQRAICLGTSPSHAWYLSGNIMATRGEVWDLWQVTLDEGDEVYPMSFFGYRLDEIRVVNPIPKRRIWLVGSRMH